MKLNESLKGRKKKAPSWAGFELEVERAHFIRARAEPELSESSPDEPEPD